LLVQARAAKAEDMLTGGSAGRRYVAPDEELGLRHLGGRMLRRPMSAFEGKSGHGHYAVPARNIVKRGNGAAALER